MTAACLKNTRQPKLFLHGLQSHKGNDPHIRRAGLGPGKPGLLKKGVVIRHMVLPGAKEDSIRLLHWIKEELPPGQFLLSILSQYTPFYKSSQYPEIRRRITTYEYQKVVDTAIELGLTDGYMQEKKQCKRRIHPAL